MDTWDGMYLFFFSPTLYTHKHMHIHKHTHTYRARAKRKCESQGEESVWEYDSGSIAVFVVMLPQGGRSLWKAAADGLEVPSEHSLCV